MKKIFFITLSTLSLLSTNIAYAGKADCLLLNRYMQQSFDNDFDSAYDSFNSSSLDDIFEPVKLKSSELLKKQEYSSKDESEFFYLVEKSLQKTYSKTKLNPATGKVYAMYGNPDLWAENAIDELKNTNSLNQSVIDLSFVVNWTLLKNPNKYGDQILKIFKAYRSYDEQENYNFKKSLSIINSSISNISDLISDDYEKLNNEQRKSKVKFKFIKAVDNICPRK